VSAPGSHSGSAGRPQRVETILVVEDEEEVRNLIRRVLEDEGYAVLAVSQGADALMLGKSYDRPIDLLLADLSLPDMNGRELAQRIRSARPEMKLLYVSGHADTAVVEFGIFPEGMLFLPKPFTPADLSKRVREVLDATYKA
jgi:two-component system, cell cycle sensor histidine kinase and response regulator CckA